MTITGWGVRRWPKAMNVLGAGSALLLACAIPTTAQSRREVSSEYTCRDCQVKLSLPTTLSSAGARSSPMFESMVAQDSRGNFYVGPTSSPGVVNVYEKVRPIRPLHRPSREGPRGNGGSGGGRDRSR